MNNAQKIETLLHVVRSPASTFEDLYQLSVVTNQATAEELELATRKYIYAMLTSAQRVMKMELAIIESQGVRH